MKKSALIELVKEQLAKKKVVKEQEGLSSLAQAIADAIEFGTPPFEFGKAVAEVLYDEFANEANKSEVAKSFLDGFNSTEKPKEEVTESIFSKNYVTDIRPDEGSPWSNELSVMVYEDEKNPGSYKLSLNVASSHGHGMSKITTNVLGTAAVPMADFTPDNIVPQVRKALPAMTSEDEAELVKFIKSTPAKVAAAVENKEQ